MKTKIVGIIKEGNRLKILFKRPLFKDLYEFIKPLNCLFMDEDNYLGLHPTEKNNIISAEFVLRSKKDVEPYKIDYENIEKAILSQYDYAILVKGCNIRLIDNSKE